MVIHTCRHRRPKPWSHAVLYLALWGRVGAWISPLRSTRVSIASRHPSTCLASSLDDHAKRSEWNQELDTLLGSQSVPSSDKAVGPSPNRLRQAVKFLQQDYSERYPGVKRDASDARLTVSPLSKANWDALFWTIEEVTAAETYEQEINPPPSSTDSATVFPLASTARNDMVDVYQVLADRGDLQLYGAVSTTQPPAVVSPAGSSYQVVTPAALESILGMPMAALTPRPTNTFLLAGTALALMEVLASVTLDISLNTLVLVTILCATLDRVLVNGAILESALQTASPGIRDKIIRHEAGHLLIAYLLGCPVEGIVLSAWAALKDERFGGGRRHVSAGTSFFDPQLSSQINTSASRVNGGVGASTVTRDSIDRYSIIVMAGIAAEADHYGQADGGAGDEMALVAFLQRLAGKVSWNDSDQIRTQARWGALQAVLLLRQYKPAHEAIIDTLQRGGRLGDCIFALERAAREHNLPTRATRTPVGYLSSDSSKGWEWSTARPDEVTPPSASPTVAPFDESKARQALQDYKQQVEQQLVTVQEQLQNLEQRNPRI